MRTHIALISLLSVFASSILLAAEELLIPGWSEVKLLVVEDATGNPVVGARVEHTCTISPYYGKPFETDSNGVARVMIFRTWVGLRATWNGLTNSVSVGGTNAVASFCSNAVIRLQYRGPRAPPNKGTVFSIKGHPRLDTNQVMLTASAVAESHRRDIRDYVCQFVGFAGSSTDSNISNKWILHFEHQQRWHNHGFFISIDDATGATSWLTAD